MSKCWKCNKEFYSENLIRTLCDECLEKIPKTTATTDFVNLLNSEIKDLVDDFSKRKISELEEKLKNAIIPKFKIGQEVYSPNKYNYQVYKLKIISIHIMKHENTKYNSLSYMATRLKDNFNFGYLEEELFNTKEEAEEKLKEMMKSE